MRRLAVAAVALLALGPACASAGPGTTSLTITAWPQGRDAGNGRTWTLRCDPAGGTLPRRSAACRQLAARDEPFSPIPDDVACIEIYGGPQEALVRGRHRGRRVWARFDRTDGCQIGRWNRVRLLFPIRVGVR